ncbi:hypothetical protein MJM83_29385, partial [Salmonella enterica subsp. enterica serovar Montevideo]|nr:hypothetical protein [Salmonella enterica subsp. enterica serovar Montevideo]
VAGGFDAVNFALVTKKRKLIDTLAQQILEAHFPTSIQEDIADVRISVCGNIACGETPLGAFPKPQEEGIRVEGDRITTYGNICTG